MRIDIINPVFKPHEYAQINCSDKLGAYIMTNWSMDELCKFDFVIYNRSHQIEDAFMIESILLKNRLRQQKIEQFKEINESYMLMKTHYKNIENDMVFKALKFRRRELYIELTNI